MRIALPVIIMFISFLLSECAYPDETGMWKMSVVAQYKFADESVSWLECSPDGSKLLVSTDYEHIYELKTEGLVLERELRTRASRAMFASNGELIVSRTTSDVINLIDGTAENIIARVSAAPTFRVDLKRNYLALEGSRGRDQQSVFLFDLTKRAVTHRCKVDGEFLLPSLFRLSPSGIIGISPLDGRTVLLWFPPYDEPPIPLEVGREVLDLHVSPDGLSAALGTDDNRVEVWDVKSRRLSRQLEKHDRGSDGEVRCVSFSSDGHILASLSLFGEIAVWDTKTLKEVVRKQAHEGTSYNMLILPDNRHIVTAGNRDRTVKLWRIEGSLAATP